MIMAFLHAGILGKKLSFKTEKIISFELRFYSQKGAGHKIKKDSFGLTLYTLFVFFNECRLLMKKTWSELSWKGEEKTEMRTDE